jgi:hypothetical protein
MQGDDLNDAVTVILETNHVVGISANHFDLINVHDPFTTLASAAKI